MLNDDVIFKPNLRICSDSDVDSGDQCILYSVVCLCINSRLNYASDAVYSL